MISAKTALQYFEKAVSSDDNCPSIRSLYETLKNVNQQDDSADEVSFETLITPIIETANEYARSADAPHPLVIQSASRHGTRYRVNEITTALAAGFEPAEGKTLSHFNTHTILDVDAGFGLATMTRAEYDHAAQRMEVRTKPVAVPFDALIQEAVYDSFKTSLNRMPNKVLHTALSTVTRTFAAHATLSADYEEGESFFMDAMAKARAELDEEVKEGGEIDVDAATLYTFDMSDWIVMLLSIRMQEYVLFAQAGDVDAQGYDASAWRNTMFNIFDGGLVEAIIDDLFYISVEQPEDATARCHNIIARALSMQAATEELIKTYGALADTHNAETKH
jgi:hypothetical protein